MNLNLEVANWCNSNVSKMGRILGIRTLHQDQYSRTVRVRLEKKKITLKILRLNNRFLINQIK